MISIAFSTIAWDNPIVALSVTDNDLEYANNRNEIKYDSLKVTLLKGLPLANTAFSPTCLNTSSGVHSAATKKRPMLVTIFKYLKVNIGRNL